MLEIVNYATVIIGVGVSFRISVFISSSYIPRSRTAGSYGTSFFCFVLFLRNLNTVFHSGKTVGGF